MAQEHIKTKLIEAEHIVIRDAAGGMRMNIGGDEDGAYGISIWDGGGAPRAHVRVERDGRAVIKFVDRQGQVRLRFGLDADDSRTLGPGPSQVGKFELEHKDGRK